ncbi:MAG TPA: hypothetical protein VL096_00905 [Pirellulaceae bacterium]|nr:hypothetical protein [Pirellulaceae bacterium]
MRRIALGWFFISLVTCLTLTGCGGGGTRSEVSGQVLLDGQPLAGAEVQLLPKDNPALGMHSGTTDATGKFVIVESGSSNTPFKAGKYVALVSKQSMPANAASLPGGGMGAMVNEVPPLYQDRAASPLIVEITGTTTALAPFEISKTPKK